MIVRVHVATFLPLLYLTAPIVNDAFPMDLLQMGTTVQGEEAERTRLKQKANDFAVDAVDLSEEAGHVVLPVFKTIE